MIFCIRGGSSLAHSLQKEGLGLSDDTIASNLNIDKSTVSRTMQRFVTTGTVAKLPRGGSRGWALGAEAPLLHF